MIDDATRPFDAPLAPKPQIEELQTTHSDRMVRIGPREAATWLVIVGLSLIILACAVYDILVPPVPVHHAAIGVPA